LAVWDAFLPLKEHARDFGLAFAAVMIVHLGLVAWLCTNGAAPPMTTFVIFGIAAAFTYLLALLSNQRVRALLPYKSWPWIRALAMNYVAMAFLYDFTKLPASDLYNALRLPSFRRSCYRRSDVEARRQGADPEARKGGSGCPK
jgi:hypothetical protein